MPVIEPGAFHMQSERSTTEPHPHIIQMHTQLLFYFYVFIYTFMQSKRLKLVTFFCKLYECME